MRQKAPGRADRAPQSNNATSGATLVANIQNMPFGKLLDQIDGLDNVLKEVSSSPRLEHPRLLFLRFRENEPELNALAELLTDLLVDYAIPLSKRQQANTAGSNSTTQGGTAAHVRLYREAKRLLIQYEKASRGRYGELGELLSYALAVNYLGAAQIGSKMALKTSQGMPVHGVDGLHVKANDDGTVTFFVLESKVMPDATDASREMVVSIADYRADRAKKLNELRLVTDLSNFDALVGEQREAAKSFFNVYQGNGNHLKRRDVHVGSLVFNESAYQDRLSLDHERPITIHEEHFEALYREKHGRFKANLERQAMTKNLDLGNCIVFFVAVPDVNELKRVFAELNR